MAKSVQRETYYKDPINTVRSFMPVANLPHTPIAIPSTLRKILEHNFMAGLPDDILLLVAYVEQLRLINSLGYHIELPKLLDNLLALSQEYRQINFHDPLVQQQIREGIVE